MSNGTPAMNWISMASKTAMAFAGTMVIAFACACGAESEDMATAESTFQEKASKTILAYMTLETMFPDARARLLASAAGEGNLAEVDRLVAEGVNVDSRGTQNATPLFWSMRNPSGFTKLLELGANPNVVFGDGGSVMHWAARAEDTGLLRAALRHGGDPNLVAGAFERTPLFEAIGRNDTAALDLLLDAGADIDARSSNGDTAAMVAAGRGRFDVVYLLLSRGASYSVPNDNGVTLVDRVVDKQGAMDPEHDLARWLDKVVEWLRERGVEIRG